MALSEQEMNRLKVLAKAKASTVDVSSIETSPQTLLGKAKSVGLGFGKGLLDTAVGTARMMEGLGKRTLALVDPTRTYDQIKEDTGFESLKGKNAEDIDAMLKSKDDYERAGKVGAFITELLLPTGSRKVVQKGLEKTAQKGGKVISKTGEILKSGKELVKGVKDLTVMAGQGASKIPSRIITNVAEKKSVMQAVKQLPSELARRATQEGIDINDVKHIYNIPNSQKTKLKKLADVVQKFAKGETKVNPIEVVGKPITGRIKQLETARSVIGQKLGKVSEKLGTVTPKDTFTPIFDSLKKVPGLHGLKVNKKGMLDFADTVLTTAETKADRSAIQKIFIDAVKGGTGKQKHLLRQEIFEVLGGKKKSLTNLTDTQEKAYEAIRKGLSSVLEGKNSLYKKLSNDYRKVAQPLQDMRKFMKNVAGADEDIVDMAHGLLARRLTSNAPSNPQLRKILRAMDEATKVKGKSQLSVEHLQDFYNILERYYDIAAKTGFQGQVRSGVEKASGVKDFIMQAVSNVAGKTDAVRKKALEDALGEIFK